MVLFWSLVEDDVNPLKFFKQLAEMVSKKKKSHQSETLTWINRKINFLLIKSLHVCLRGSRPVVNQIKESVYSPHTVGKLSDIKI